MMSNDPNDTNNRQQDTRPEAYSQKNPLPVGGAGGSSGLPQDYMPPPRFEVAPDISPIALAGEAPQRQFVSVPGVVGANNTFRPYYDVSRESKIELSKLGETQRLAVQRQLYAAGWYGSRTPQFVVSAKKGVGYLGLSDADVNTFAEFLDTANRQGVTYDILLNSISKAPRIETGVGVSRQSRPSSETLAEILQRTALETIGRKLDDKTVSELTKTYQTAYVGGGSEQPASADVFFQNRIEQKYGAETEATKYLTAVSSIVKLLGG